MKNEPVFRIRCPVKQCDGWVIVEGTNFVCEECGSIWTDRTYLNDSIAEAIEGWPYRASCYLEGEGGYVPAHEDDEHPDYEDLVECECLEEESDDMSGQGDR